jgi:hypothetical protein
MRVYIRLLVLSLSVVLLIGIFLYHEWWSGFLYGGGFRDLSWWIDGGVDALQQIAVGLVTLAALLALMHVLRLARLQEVRALLQRVIGSPRAGDLITLLTLAIFVAIAITVGAMSEGFWPSPKSATGSFAMTVSDPALTSTTFLYIDREAVEKLSGQYEPELVPELVVSEIKSSSDVKVGVSVEDYLKTEVGKTEFQRRLTQYKELAKTPERKLKDLLPYLAQKHLMERFWGTLSNPVEFSKLDVASATLRGQGIQVDERLLAAAREKLLAEQLHELEEKLRNLQGLVLIEGEWSVQGRGDRYVFMKPIVENVTHSSLAQFTVKRSDLTQGYEAMIEGSKGRTLHLRLFGNVLIGTADVPGTILIQPEGLFL